MNSTGAAATFVLCILLLVGLYDTAVGLYMLSSPRPWLAHGPGTVWIPHGDLAPMTESALRRIGAFSFHAGLLTLVLAWYAHRRARLRTVFMATYLMTGLAFAWTDAAWFAGTLYWWIKLGLGVLFALAALVQFTLAWTGRWPAET